MTVKNGSNTYLGEDEVKELVIICDHLYFSRKHDWTKTASCLLKGRGRGEKPCDTDTGNEQSVGGFPSY